MTDPKQVETTQETSDSSKEGKKAYDPADLDSRWIISSFLFAVIISVAIYLLPDYLFIEQITTEIVLFVLNTVGVTSELSTRSINPLYIDETTIAISFEWLGIPKSLFSVQFTEASNLTPAVHMFDPSQGENGMYDDFYIVKACTGMQAGAILMALIMVTKAPENDSYSDKMVRVLRSVSFGQVNLDPSKTNGVAMEIIYKFGVAFIFFWVLFFTNSLRIAFHLYLVGAHGVPFIIAHDDLSKPIGFVGTLLFAWSIEKMGIPIIDQFADWLDWTFYRLKLLTGVK